MQNNGRDNEDSVEREEVKEESNTQESEQKVQDQDPLKFFVQIGDCSPQIYNLVIAFNPEVDISKLNIDEKFFRGLVEDTNKALVPVLQKYINILKDGNT